MWNEITFAQLLYYTEEMQSQQRAENGVREIVIGFVGYESDENVEAIANDLGELNSAFAVDGQQVERVTIEELPDDVRSIYLAEQHRRNTGQLRKADDFKIKEVEVS